MGNLFASTGLGDENPHERDVEYCGFAGRRPYERQNENPETPAVHMFYDVLCFSQYLQLDGAWESVEHVKDDIKLVDPSYHDNHGVKYVFSEFLKIISSFFRSKFLHW